MAALYTSDGGKGERRGINAHLDAAGKGVKYREKEETGKRHRGYGGENGPKKKWAARRKQDVPSTCGKEQRISRASREEEAEEEGAS